MADAPKTRGRERRFTGPIADGPADKTAALPIPQVGPAARETRGAGPERPAPTRWPRRAPKDDAAGREAYPGPQQASTGERVDPGTPPPTGRRSKSSGGKA